MYFQAQRRLKILAQNSRFLTLFYLTAGLGGMLISPSMALAKTALQCEKNTLEERTKLSSEQSLEETLQFLELALLGGLDSISHSYYQYDSEWIDYNDGQSAQHSNPSTRLSHSEVHIERDLLGEQLRQSWVHDVEYPYEFHFEFVESMGPDGAYVDGRTSFGGPKKTPMSSARRGQRAKESFMASPWALLDYLKGSEAQATLTSSKLGPQIQFERWHLPFTLQLHGQGFLPLYLETLEDRPAFGDTPIRLNYSRWLAVDGLGCIPGEIEHQRNQKQSRLEQRRNILPLATLDLKIPAKALTPLNEKEAHYGRVRSRFLNDWMDYGFPMDEAPFDHDFKHQEVSPGVHYFTGEFHQSMVIELPSSLLVVEAPFSPERVDALFTELHSRWPEKPITDIIATHWHWDHVGGLRSAAAEGATIYVPGSDEAVLRGLFTAEKSLYPDSLSKAKVPVRLQAITQKKVFVEGGREVWVLPTSENAHSEGMLLVYLPESGVLFNSDLFNPGLVPTRGFRGILGRAAMKAIAPNSLQKAQHYAAELQREIDNQGLHVQTVLGGHGPKVAKAREIHVLAKAAE